MKKIKNTQRHLATKNKTKQFKNFNKHLRYFIALAVTMFIGVSFIHLCLIIQGSGVNILSLVMPIIASYLILFISVSMVVMGVYYYRALDSK